MTSRRDALTKLFKGAVATGAGGLLWGNLASNAAKSAVVLRPPGALSENEFVKACIRCGLCVTNCPYNTLTLAGTNEEITPGTPYFKPRSIPCYMCTTYPCVKVCPTNALSEQRLIIQNEKANINNAKMGLAVVHRESCIAYQGIQCDACYRACPLMGKAITLHFEKNLDTGRHANLLPVVHSDFCTGCGMCEHACVTEKAAIFVLPVDMAVGKTGDHYLLLKDKETSKKTVEQPADKDTESALDYLNNSETLSD